MEEKDLTRYYIRREVELKINELEKQLAELKGYLEKRKILDSVNDKCTFNSLNLYKDHVSFFNEDGDPMYSHFRTFIFIKICSDHNHYKLFKMGFSKNDALFLNAVPLEGMSQALCISKKTLSEIIKALKEDDLIQEVKHYWRSLKEKINICTGNPYKGKHFGLTEKGLELSKMIEGADNE